MKSPKPGFQDFDIILYILLIPVETSLDLKAPYSQKINGFVLISKVVLREVDNQEINYAA